MKRILGWLVALATLTAIAACGGSGSSGGGSGGSGNVSMYATDGFNDDYSHVWLSLRKIELRNSSNGVFTTEFDDPNGMLIDAKTLRDANGGLFAFLGRASLENGSYDGVRVTIGTEAVLVRTGSTNGQTYTVANPVSTFPLNPALTVPSTNPVVVDFDLSQFTVSGNSLTVKIAQGSSNGINNSGQHVGDEFRGTVSNLTANRFRLSPQTTGGFDVTFTAQTPITNGSSGAPATLQNGQTVEVRGTFVPSNGAFAATRIQVESGQSSGQAEADGRHSNVDLNANRMVLNDIVNIENFLPQGSTVNVTWDSNTIFRRSGVVVTEAALNQWQFSEVHGTFEPGTNTIRATRITLEDELNGNGGEAEVTGRITNPDLQANTMVLRDIFDVQGFSQQGSTVNVRWTNETIFRRSGNVVTEQALLQWPFAEAEGVFDSQTNTITASKITLED